MVHRVFAARSDLDTDTLGAKDFGLAPGSAKPCQLAPLRCEADSHSEGLS
jgi:hypothetical protein